LIKEKAHKINKSTRAAVKIVAIKASAHAEKKAQKAATAKAKAVIAKKMLKSADKAMKKGVK